MTRRVYIVDDDEPIRHSTGLMLTVSGFEVSAFEDGPRFLQVAGDLPPGVVLLDLRMPELDGIQVQERLRRCPVPHEVIMLTAHGEIRVAVIALRRGASGFLEKPFPKQTLMEVLSRAYERLERTDGVAMQRKRAQAMVCQLRPAEKQILEYLASGLSNGAIAARTGASISAVEIHRANLLSALGVKTIVEALTIAFDAGLPASGSVKA